MLSSEPRYHGVCQDCQDCNFNPGERCFVAVQETNSNSSLIPRWCRLADMLQHSRIFSHTFRCRLRRRPLNRCRSVADVTTSDSVCVHVYACQFYASWGVEQFWQVSPWTAFPTCSVWPARDTNSTLWCFSAAQSRDFHSEVWPKWKKRHFHKMLWCSVCVFVFKKNSYLNSHFSVILYFENVVIIIKWCDLACGMQFFLFA